MSKIAKLFSLFGRHPLLFSLHFEEIPNNPSFKDKIYRPLVFKLTKFVSLVGIFFFPSLNPCSLSIFSQGKFYQLPGQNLQDYYSVYIVIIFVQQITPFQVN